MMHLCLLLRSVCLWEELQDDKDDELPSLASQQHWQSLEIDLIVAAFNLSEQEDDSDSELSVGTFGGSDSEPETESRHGTLVLVIVFK